MKVLTHDKSSVWYGAVMRADKSKIKLGFCSNIQDRYRSFIINTLSMTISCFFVTLCLLFLNIGLSLHALVNWNLDIHLMSKSGTTSQ